MDTTIYPTREAYARKVFASLDEQTQRDILADYGTYPISGMEWSAFFADFTDNMDARNNGTVTFTRVEGGYTVEDDAATDDGLTLDTSRPGWPRRVHGEHLAADADHTATGEDECDTCGLAVTGDGRHGFTEWGE